ncbi:type II toxin-antitoxin system RelE/ParE family toxin [Rhizobium sp. CFBP 13726]|uniref:type II toxin-antitoxin system RelE/ParE family toxin n=1 Tax=Rhizobium sp. CFBP 13726 TaxID=2775296 RepID=UPI00177C49DF|nr:type II toxin-antitoxin system RelE/ParE family toxin [Rhizobium sp. CFBP 13726]MBD8649753.1 type II toxin-antitoxin system RelE/ParE family toxin [Rhizobium sp. CFBP 13726]
MQNRYAVVLHPEAERELTEFYEYVADRAGSAVAWNYITKLRVFLSGLADFPERGTVRESEVSGIRIIGYRRSVSIAFVVRSPEVIILGLFFSGRLVSDDILRNRL